MVVSLLRKLLRLSRNKTSKEEQKQILRSAHISRSTGDNRKAIQLYREYLEFDPYDLAALNDLGVCLADIGDLPEAARYFELAYSLDDTYIAAVTNHAKLLSDRRKTDEALEHITLARLSDPGFSAVDVVYASICLSRGEIVKAQHFQLKAWLGTFDNLRVANGYLFDTTYADVPERSLASEHVFWAKTTKSVSLSPLPEPKLRGGGAPTRKRRIGYWSPDFRNHSVRYFFRPLLEGHDKNTCETYLYHDFFGEDKQTQLIKGAADHFFEVCDKNDADLQALMISHDLDVLIELAGHSSHNRIALLQNRLARTQLTGIGYPPTTGLSSLDGKLIDVHIAGPESAKFYSEPMVVLPSSFWCFDPIEKTPEVVPPPMLTKGFITFGCIGNIAKISDRILLCWSRIGSRLPRSRFVVQSISFEDDSTQKLFKIRLEAVGISPDRVDLKPPALGDDYFRSYNEVDIALDTFPFNGGTTTCFAVYMGVPVISLYGEALPSRMGLSVMANLGAADLAVPTDEAYISKAIEVSQNVKFLKSFRENARQRMKACSLGNGRMFAADLEGAIEQLLAFGPSRAHATCDHVSPLPVNELVRRAYATLRRGQVDAASRIAKYCLEEYPESGVAHILATHALTSLQDSNVAIEYLSERLGRFAPDEQVAAYINIIRHQLLAGESRSASETLARAQAVEGTDAFDQRQLALYRAHLLSISNDNAVASEPSRAQASAARLKVLLPCDDVELAEAIFTDMRRRLICPSDLDVQFERCDEKLKMKAYSESLMSSEFDYLVILQKSIEIFNPYFFSAIVNALQGCDVIGFAGARRWEHIHWILSPFDQKAGSFIEVSEENPKFYELMVIGGSEDLVLSGMRVIDGALMAIRLGENVRQHFDANLLDAETLLEQDWVYRLSAHGGLIGVHQNLGVLLRRDRSLSVENRIEARRQFVDVNGIDIFSMDAEDSAFLVAPVQSLESAMRTMDVYLQL